MSIKTVNYDQSERYINITYYHSITLKYISLYLIAGFWFS